MTDLRTATIRLAYENPELQPLLLPLLKDAKKADEDEDEDEDDDGEKESKFERGEDVPLSEMPKKLQENAEDPPPSVQKVKEQIKSKNKKADEAALFKAAAALAQEQPELRPLLMPVLKKHFKANSEIPTPPNPSNDRANDMGWAPGKTEVAKGVEDFPVHNPDIGLGKEASLLRETIKLASEKPELREKLLPVVREATVLPLLEDEFVSKEAKRWEDKPKGWTDESRKKFWNTLTSGSPKHKVTACMKKMEGKVSNTGAFCGALADRVLGKEWRTEAAKKDKSAAETKLANDDESLTIEEVRELCPPCAEKMAAYNLKTVKASVLRKAIKLANDAKS